MSQIRTIGVCGAGVMGSQLAAFFASAGFEVYLFDLKQELAEKGLAGAAKARPPAFYHPRFRKNVVPCHYGAHRERFAECDWIIEAIAERLDWKQALYAEIEPYLQEHAVLSSNTSGLSLADLTANLDEDVRRRFPEGYQPLHIAVRGHMGTGKDHDIEQFAAMLRLPYYRIPLTGEVRDVTLIGSTLLHGDGKGGTESRWEDGEITRALRGPALVNLSELNAAGAETLFALHGLLDRYAALDLPTDAANQALRKHVEAGGRAVITVREQGERVLLMVRGEHRMLSVPAKAIPSLSVPHGRRYRESQLFAVALAYGMGLQLHEIQLALRHGRARPRASRATAVARKQSA